MFSQLLFKPVDIVSFDKFSKIGRPAESNIRINISIGDNYIESKSAQHPS